MAFYHHFIVIFQHCISNACRRIHFKRNLNVQQNNNESKAKNWKITQWLGWRVCSEFISNDS